VKKIIGESQRGFKPMTPKGLVNKGPQFGHSRIQTSGIGGKSTQSRSSMGDGLASRFSLALSRVIENPAPGADLQCEEDINEIVQLVNELNQHQDLTVKLNS